MCVIFGRRHFRLCVYLYSNFKIYSGCLRMMILILVSFSCTAYIHLRTPGGPRTPVWKNGFVCRFQGREKKLVSYICTNRCGTCGRGGSRGNDRVTYCRRVEERNVIAAVLVLFSVTFIQRPSIKYLHSSRQQNCIVPPDCY